MSHSRPIGIPVRNQSESSNNSPPQLQHSFVQSWGESYKRASLFRNDNDVNQTSNRYNNHLSEEEEDVGDIFMQRDAGSPVISPQSDVESLEPSQETEALLPKITRIHIPKSTFAQSCFNSVNILMGIGLLSLPFSFKITGWIAGIALLIVFSIITRHTAKLLAKCMDHDQNNLGNSYGDIGHAAFGPPGRTFISILFFMELFAACVALVILAADSIVALAPEFNLDIVKCIVVALIIPMTVSRSLSFAAYGSLLGVVAMINMMAIIFIDGFSTTESPGSLLVPALTSLEPNWSHFPFSFGLIMAGFCGN